MDRAAWGNYRVKVGSEVGFILHTEICLQNSPKPFRNPGSAKNSEAEYLFQVGGVN